MFLVTSVPVIHNCCEESCQICKFVYDTINSVVSSVSVADDMSGSATMPFLNKAAWRSAQHDCCDLRSAFANLKHGTRPSRKARNLKHLRRYLRVATLDEHGLIMVNRTRNKSFRFYIDRQIS